MRRVIMKDLIMNRTALIANLFIMAGVLVFMSSWEEGASAGAYSFFSGVMMAFVPVMVVTREDKFKAMALGCSLPVTRETIVRARYAMAVGSAVLGVALAFVLGAYSPPSQLSAAELFRPENIIRALAVSTLLLALLLPFTLRYGATGLILVLVSFQVLGIVALTLAKLSSSISDRNLVDVVVGTVADLYAQLGAGGFYLLLAAGLATVLSVSYGLSVSIFRRRDL